MQHDESRDVLFSCFRKGIRGCMCSSIVTKIDFCSQGPSTPCCPNKGHQPVTQATFVHDAPAPWPYQNPGENTVSCCPSRMNLHNVWEKAYHSLLQYFEN